MRRWPACRRLLPRPRYDRATTAPGIVHLGLGAFHRAHQAVFVDDCLNAGETGWGIIGASLRSAETRNALEPQDGLYTLSVVDGSGEKLRVIGSILSSLVAPEDPAALLDALRSGHEDRHADGDGEGLSARLAGGLDEKHPDIVWDLKNPSSAEDGAWISRRSDSSATGGRSAALHGAFLRQLAGQRRDAETSAHRLRQIARSRTRPVRRTRRSLFHPAWSTASCRRRPMRTGRA